MNATQDSNAKDFALVRRGYDPDQVEDFLAASQKEWQGELAAAEARISQLEAELASAKENEEAVHLTMVAATKTKDEMLDAAKRQLGEATAEAQAEADKIVSEAKYEAFRLVTEAKEDTDRALEEAQAEGERTVSEARQESIALLAEVKEEAERLVNRRDDELAKLRAEFEEENQELIDHVANLRAVAADLESRLEALARGALPELADIALITPPATRGHKGRSLSPPSSAEELPPAPGPDQQPPEEEGELAEVDVPASRGSFYTRRSAKLPRIGEAASKGALAAAGALRGRLGEAEEDEEEDANVSDLAMQNA